jgi:mRNA-degrading endonuclease toxin of MazEF toxin-antitoxin module
MAEPLQGEVYVWPDVKPNHPMGAKPRIWAVVSRDRFNAHSSHVLACPLASYPPNALDIEVKATPHNRLDHDSALVPRMITPILKDELTSPRGRLPRNVVAQVLDRLRMILEA